MAGAGRVEGGARFGVPRIPNATLRRSALLDRLHAGAGRPLTLVAAAAGSGKSALLVSWVAELSGPVAWLSCDRAHADERAFWRDLSRSVRSAWAPAGVVGPEVLAGSAPAHAADDAVALAGELTAADAPGVVVVDDFHLARVDPGAMLDFVGALPRGVRLVLAGRADPAFPLGRLRLQGNLLELRQDDLRFTAVEARAALGSIGVTLDDDGLGRLIALTEGWPAGVHLLGLSLRDRPDQGGLLERWAATDRNLTEFLMSEVVAGQEPEVRDFLLVTAELESFDAGLCDAVTGRADSTSVLEAIRRNNLLLIELDGPAPSFRYHHLFQEFLRLQHRAAAPGRVGEVHRAAARAYEARGDLGGAIRHRLAAGDVDGARALLGDALTSTLSLSDGAMAASVARAWFAEYGPAHLDAEPSNLLESVMALDIGGATDEAESWLRQWDRRVERCEPTEPLAHVLLDGAWSFHHLVTGDPEAARARGRAAARTALEHGVDDRWITTLPVVLVQADLWLGDLDAAGATVAAAVAAGSGAPALEQVRLPGFASQIDLQAGDLLAAGRAAARALAAADRLGLDALNFGRAEPELTLAAVALERGDLDEAADRVERVLRISEVRRPPLEVAGLLVLAQVSAARGDATDADAIVARARAVQPRATAMATARIDEVACRLALAGGDCRTAESLVGALPDVPARPLLAARARLAAADRPGARAILDEAAGRCATPRLRLERLLLTALAEGRAPEQAAVALEEAVVLAERNGFLRSVVAEGPELWALLEALPVTGPQAAFVGQVLAFADRSVPPASGRPAVTVDGQVLSEREQTVLRYLASRLDTAEIARELYLSANTVRSHVKSIYRKLGVSSRADAVAVGRAQGYF